jgi:hypothetical protein
MPVTYTDDSINQIGFGCNIHKLNQLVNNLFVAKHCRSQDREKLLEKEKLSP